MQTNLVTVTSHIARHTRVSSAFTCSSVQQQGLYAAASVGRRGSKCIQRAPAETTEARVLLLLLCSWPGAGEHRGCWWRRVSHFKRVSSPLFLPHWIMANTTLCLAVCPCVSVCLCVYYSILSRIWTIYKAPTVFVLFISRPHALFSSPPDPTRDCMTAQRALCLCVCVWTRVLVCTRRMKCVHESGKQSHMEPVMSHSPNSSLMFCVIQLSAHWAPSAAFSTMCVRHVEKPRLGGGYHPGEWEGEFKFR